MRQPYVVPRRRLAIAVWLTALALPILVIDNISRTDARAAQARVAVASAEAPTTSAPPTTVLTTIPWPADAPPPTSAPRRATTTTTVKARTTVSTVRTAAPAGSSTATVSTAAATAPAGNSQDGEATFYSYIPGQCAHVTIPKGTVVTVTRVDTGASITCVVTDRGPYADPGRIIDLDRSDFARLADPALGVIEVHLSW